MRKIGIADDAIRTQEIGDYWRQKGKEFLIGKQLGIRLTDFEQINSIIRSVNTWGIESMRIGELKHKDLPMYRKQGKIEALKAAREKASYLVEAMGQQLGEVIRIIEPADNNISRYLPFEAQSNVSMGAAATEQYQVIKLRYEMTAVLPLNKNSISLSHDKIINRIWFNKQSVFLIQIVLSFALG